jgi:hypothetical protein
MPIQALSGLSARKPAMPNFNPSRRLQAIAVGCVAMAAAACTAGAAPEPGPAGPPVAPVKCVASDFTSFRNQPQGILAAATFPQGLTVRVIAPGQPVTMDYSESRVNFLTDGKGVIRDISCG